MPHVLALDFDGVICDSLLEAYLLTCRIAPKFDPSLAPAQNWTPTLTDIQKFRDCNPGHWQHFISIVPFANRAEGYLVIQKAVSLKRNLSTQEDFDSFCSSSLKAEDLEAFHEEFYRERYSLEARDREGWLRLNEPFPGVKAALGELSERFALSVVTSKDAKTVRALLEHYGVSPLFKPGLILDKETGASKRAHLGALREIFGCSFREITFIDDKVAHLIDCQDLGIRLYLSAWGYNGSQERRLAESRGIAVLELNNLASLHP
ncbi:MAG TPA: HAD hydrolase-like protein [archaeon]|nr:HAD hydrolase-like protein [archaeon]